MALKKYMDKNETSTLTSIGAHLCLDLTYIMYRLSDYSTTVLVDSVR